MNYIPKIKNDKSEFLAYFRSRANESLADIRRKFAENQPLKRASEINKSINGTKNNLISAVLQSANKEKWSRQDKLECLLMINYCNAVVMIECRNSVRKYEYMDFSRRIGELWEPFCKLCFDYPINEDVSLFIPPLFSEVRKKLTDEIVEYIGSLSISKHEKNELKKYYDKVWGLVTSGEIKLERERSPKRGGDFLHPNGVQQRSRG